MDTVHEAAHNDAELSATPQQSQSRRTPCYRHHPSHFRSSYAADHASLLETLASVTQLLFAIAPSKACNSVDCLRTKLTAIPTNCMDALADDACAMQRLAALSEHDRETVRSIWATYEAASAPVRTLIADGILHASCLPQLSHISSRISTLTRVDFIAALPTEISLNILRYLDGKSLCYCAQVSRRWRAVADDDALWHRMCTQHIDRKCDKCGWGLPLMQKQPPKRLLSSSESSEETPKRLRTDQGSESVYTIASSGRRKYRRPWKEVYAERLIVERNWRTANFTVRDLIGHEDGIMALDYDDTRGLLVTGSYDHTLRAWDVNTGECLGIMRGHTLCVRGVQFDDTKIISCSMDRTLRIWSMSNFACLRVIEGHNEGVVCLHFTDLLLASGSTDGMIRVRNLATGVSSTLDGHTDWINKVHILPCKKRLLSCSDDTTTRLWDIHTRETLRIFSGHVAPIQSLKVVFSRHPNSQPSTNTQNASQQPSAAASGSTSDLNDAHEDASIRLVTCSLDHTVKVWNLHTGQTIHTLFGHVEGVWCVDADSLRIVSGSHDHTLKVWDLNSGECLYTIDGEHQEAVNCCRIADTKLISADQQGVIKVRDSLHNFRPKSDNAAQVVPLASAHH